MKRNHAILALLLLACLLLPQAALATGGSGVSNLKGTAYSAIHIKLTWSGSASAYEVNYKPVNGSFRYFDEVTNESALIIVAPDTTYEITVNARGGKESAPIYVTTPSYSTTREYNYRYISLSLYAASANTNLDFWEDETRTRYERIQRSLLAGAGEMRDFYAISDFTMSPTSQEKALDYVVVLTPPYSPDRYLTSGVLSVPGSWDNALYAYYLSDMFKVYLEYNDSFAPGVYALEVFLNGWLGGKTTFVVE